jgi:hypothetical protein
VIFCTTSRSNLTIALDTNCKKLALRGDEPPANLHAAEQRLNLPRRTCTITDDNGDTIFVNEVQPKPTSPGHDRTLLPKPQHRSLRDPDNTPPSHCEHVAMSSWLQQQPPSHIYEEARVTESMTRTRPYTAKYNSSLIVTGLYKYSIQYLTANLVEMLSQTYSEWKSFNTLAWRKIANDEGLGLALGGHSLLCSC